MLILLAVLSLAGINLTGTPVMECPEVRADVVCYVLPESPRETIEERALALGVTWFGDWSEAEGLSVRLFELDGVGYVVGYWGSGVYVGLLSPESE